MENWEDIRREWLPGDGEVPLAPEVIMAGYAAVRRFLGPTWPEDVFDGCRGQIFLRWLVALGQRLELIADLPGSEKIVRKIASEGVRSSALAELATAAALHGREMEIAFEAPAPDGTRVPDLRVLVGGSLVYIEIARPDMSQEQTSASTAMVRLTKRIYEARADVLLVEALVWWPIDSAAEARLLAAASSEAAAIPGTSIELSAIGGLWIGELGSPDEDASLFQSVSRIEPPLGDEEMAVAAPHFAAGEGSSRRRSYVEIRIPFSERLRGIFDHERKQLPKDEPGIIVLDLTWFPDGFRIAQRLVEQSLRLTGRVGAAVLFEESEGRVVSLRNPNPRSPLPEGFVDILERGLRELIRR